MTNIIKKSAVQLGWDEVCDIISEEIENISGLHVQCKANVMEDSFWDVTFINCRLPLPNLCHLLQITQATSEDWVTTLPDEGERDVNGIGMDLAEKLVGRHLSLTWEEHLITEDSLWLVGVTDACGVGDLQKFSVTITETLQMTVEVEASDSQQAEDMVTDGWRSKDYVLGANDLLNAKFEAVPAADKSNAPCRTANQGSVIQAEVD